MPSTRSGKRQSRLEFAPLPRSSPVTVDEPTSLSPPSKKRRITIRDYLPTPAASSQTQGSRAAKDGTSDESSSEEEDQVDSRQESEEDGQSKQDSESINGNDDQVEEDEDEDDLPVRPRRRPAQEPSTPSNHRSSQDNADLIEDLDFLGDADVDSPRALRERGTSVKKTAKQKALEALKKRRQRSHGRDQAQRRTINEEDESEDEDEGDSNAYLEDDFAHEADDFIVEDADGDEIGGPAEIPFEFKLRTMKPKELFRIVVGWMVQKKINPAFDMQDEVYEIAFMRLDDFVRGMGGSKFQSSAWTPIFSRMLKSRPTLMDKPITASILRDRCDACNRSGHPATWEVTFSGKPYDKNTLEEESDDDSEDLDEEDAGEEEDTTVFYIGKFCMRNAKTAHALAHWKYHLKDWTVQYLQDVGELTPAKIVLRDSWNTRKRRKDAERIVDEMERVGEIKNLHRDFRNEINEAHTSQGVSPSSTSKFKSTIPWRQRPISLTTIPLCDTDVGFYTGDVIDLLTGLLCYEQASRNTAIAGTQSRSLFVSLETKARLSPESQVI